MNKHLVFVYGSLRNGGEGALSMRFPHAKFIGAAGVSGSLYDLGAYPGMQRNASNTAVIGEVYEVDDETLKALDAFEDSTNYLRKVCEVVLGNEKKSCWVYEPNPELYSLTEVISSGDWIEYVRTQKE